MRQSDIFPGRFPAGARKSIEEEVNYEMVWGVLWGCAGVQHDHVCNHPDPSSEPLRRDEIRGQRNTARFVLTDGPSTL